MPYVSLSEMHLLNWLFKDMVVVVGGVLSLVAPWTRIHLSMKGTQV